MGMTFDPLSFFVAVFIGILFIYLTTPRKIIIKNPTIENLENTTYIDDNDVCYRYKKKQVSCSEQ